ncbi:MAG: YfhO family protein, partial [Coprobacillus sp.]
EILSSSNLVKTSDGFEVKKEDAKVKLSFNGQKNTELYAFFDNLIFKTYKDNDNVQVTSAYVTLEVGGVSKTINLKNEYNNYYNGTKDFLVQLGYNVEPRSEIEITFHTPGKYICDNLNITGLNMKNFDQQVSKLKENILEDVVIETNKVTGNISLDKDKFLCLSIPYSTGWSVLVDGKEETLLKANTMYMGVNLKKGNHTIELVYTTPLLMIGAIATSIGVLMLGGIVFIRKSNKNKE